MKIKTSELIGAQLDWAASEAAEIAVVRRSGGMCCEVVLMDVQANKVWTPSTDWSQGGPLIERFKVHIARDHGMAQAAVRVPTDRGMKQGGGSGATHLIAAMRAIVASKLGNEVDVPEGLV